MIHFILFTYIESQKAIVSNGYGNPALGNQPSLQELLNDAFEIREVNSFGDCLYESLSLLAYNNTNQHLAIRKELADYMVKFDF